MKVELLREPYGDDLMVVNAARVSFDKESKWEDVIRTTDYFGEAYVAGKKLSDADTRLIQFLARGMTAADFDEFVSEAMGCGDGGLREELIDLLWEWRRNPTHWAPFAHPHASFRITAPIFVARQLAKHQIGMTWSEVSRRYVNEEPELFWPNEFRMRADNVKQGSSDEPFYIGNIISKISAANDLALDVYRDAIAKGMCPEQARMVLPQSTMTEWIWTGSLYAWANVYNQRKPGGHAQRETQEIARQIGGNMAQFFPVSWEALTAW